MNHIRTLLGVVAVSWGLSASVADAQQYGYYNPQPSYTAGTGAAWNATPHAPYSQPTADVVVSPNWGAAPVANQHMTNWAYQPAALPPALPYQGLPQTGQVNPWASTPTGFGAETAGTLPAPSQSIVPPSVQGNPWMAGGPAACEPVYAPMCAPTPLGFFATAEAAFLKYHRSDGVRFGSSGSHEAVTYDYFVSPRLTFGYSNCSFGGIRLRWWDYDHFVSRDGYPYQGLGIDTTVLDLEWFDNIYVSDPWAIVASAGIRYTEFEERMQDGSSESRINSIDAFGGTLGLEVRRRIWCGALYARGLGAILVGDKYIYNDNNNAPLSATLNDTMVGMMEFGVGYQLSHQLFSTTTLLLRAGYEWQYWLDYSSGFAGTMPGGEDFAGPSNVGFSGATVSVGFLF